jgi:Phage tail tube protein
MAQVKTLVGEKLLIQIGDGATPTEAFSIDCLINAERGVQMSAETQEFVVPDCDNPSLPGWKEMFKDGMSISVSGGGMLHTTSVENFFNWMNSDTAKNVRIKFDVSGALGGGYIAVPMKLTAFSVTGNRKQNTTADITLMSSGVGTWTDAA